jgi:small subunit ribosomal protein S6
MKSSKNKYQVVVVLNPKLEEKERVLLVDKVVAEIEKGGVKVKSKEELGLKDLAYEIKKQETGMFMVFDIVSKEGLNINKLNLFLNRQVEIIRFIILKV